MPKSNFNQLRGYLNSQILGQAKLVDNLLIALLADGHILVEGPPGLAKTRAVKALADSLDANFHRIQFTPDLLPADLTGTDIYRAETGTFDFQPGPLFHNIVLADEINRAPAKVQSALLEAMAEQQITVGNKTMLLPTLFMVMATQNPIEQEGTYPLPEAQLDRFMLHLEIDYPDKDTELQILRLTTQEAQQDTAAPITKISQKAIMQARKEVLNIHLAPALEHYLVDLIMATRNPDTLDPQLASWINFGASPRATISLARCVRARAWLHGRDHVLPEDIQTCLYPILRHRLLLSFEAEADGITANQVIDRILSLIAFS
ncbi:MoxR-like ATPase in aerotolerance operon [Moritella sp. JT01]|uniref:AAA family ATPase n=1 Tax=Moritella sp. JT01 TaxID=756698 RepID=UPI00079C70BB|nr:MoxR family ATPase [Moritella sp. JT01]KXO13009.1 MoxR-like ATPase in aerotolerance operon [Moritella sp. JT01]